MSNGRLVLCRDRCWSSLAFSYSSLKACFSSRKTLINSACGSAEGSHAGNGDQVTHAGAGGNFHLSGGLPLREQSFTTAQQTTIGLVDYWFSKLMI